MTTESAKPQTLTAAKITKKGNGWLVEATIVADLGDGIPWPYEQSFVYETTAAMLAALTTTLTREETQ